MNARTISFSFKKSSINSKLNMPQFRGERRSSHFQPSIKKTIKCINLHVFIYDIF